MEKPPEFNSSADTLKFDSTDIESSTKESTNLEAIREELSKFTLNIDDLRIAGLDMSRLSELLLRKFTVRDLVDEQNESSMEALRQIVDSFVQKCEESTSTSENHHERVNAEAPSLSGVFLSNGNFRFIKHLGQGGFANIFHAESSQQHFAIKCVLLSADEKKRRDQLEIAQREASLLRSIEHDNIVRCHDAFESRFCNQSDAYCIQLDLCGVSLKELLVQRNKLLTCADDKSSQYELPGVPAEYVRCTHERFACTVLKQLLSALGYLHEHACLAHCDVTPSNLLFELLQSRASKKHEAFNLRLCDFGLSTKLEDSHKYEPCGTRVYQAPELEDLVLVGQTLESECRKSKKFGVNNGAGTPVSRPNATLDLTKADVFSVGVIAYELGAPFATEMERSRCIANVKADARFCLNSRSQFAFDIRNGVVHQVIQAALEHHAASRATAKQLLELLA